MVVSLGWTISREDTTYLQYLSLAAALDRDVKSGDSPAGTMLPPQRILADYLDLNLIGTARPAHIRLIPVAGDAKGMRQDALDEI